MERNQAIIEFTKKGFLLDKDALEFFSNLNNLSLAETILNRIFTLTKSRIITKDCLEKNSQLFKDLLPVFSALNKKEETVVQKKEEITEPVFKRNLKILSSEIIPYRRIEVKDFVTHFRNRYNLFKAFLSDRKELSNLVSINKIGSNRNFSLIALVSSKRLTKNKNMIIEVEDLTGKKSILVGHDKEEVMKKAQEVVIDDVIGLKCSGTGEFTYANDIFFADSYIHEKIKTEQDTYALFISDIHIGSKLFLEQNFKRFLEWINGEGVDEQTKDKISRIKYIFIVGDNVDGVGVYPSQESFLTIKDISAQYALLSSYLKQIPSRITIIMCPGQHDAVRVPEPQPFIDETFAKALTEMKNVFLVTNPAFIEIESTPTKRGPRILMYHGASMHGWIEEIEELRQGQANLNPSKVVKFMLRHRHLSPMHSGNVYVPSDKDDSLAIKEVPDILVTGDMHRTDIDTYNNILIICSSCWQSITPFEEKVGNQPDPCKVPMLNLKTREVKILDFS